MEGAKETTLPFFVYMVLDNVIIYIFALCLFVLSLIVILVQIFKNDLIFFSLIAILNTLHDATCKFCPNKCRVFDH